MRKIICDRCGAEITGDRIGYVAVNWMAVTDNSLMQNNPYEHMDFCERCMMEITAFIDKKKPEDEDPEESEDEEADPEPAPVDPEPEPPPKIYKGVNLRKLRELVKAGKTAQEIAAELGCSVAMYYKHRKRAEALYNAGML